MHLKTIFSQLNHLDLQLIDSALSEDLGLPYKDLTTSLLFSQKKTNARAKIISKHPEAIIICGLPVVKAILKKLNQAYEIQSPYQDGDLLQPGGTLLTLIASPQILLMVERIVLNFLQHLCAIATFTAKFVEMIKHTPAKILDTRKTLPGFRHLEKYAVHCGGGINHRMGLYDALMIKDTHIDMVGGIEKALAALPDTITQQFPVIVEVRDEGELAVVLDKALHKVTRVLLDNMQPAHMAQCVRLCNKRIATEASGNITLNTVLRVAQSGVNFISVGQLTHSANHVDLSMKCDL